MENMECTDVPLASEKHARLHNAVINVESLGRSIDTMISRINGDDRNPQPEAAVVGKASNTAPPLLQVLDEAPGYLNDQVQIIHEKLDRLNSLLF